MKSARLLVASFLASVTFAAQATSSDPAGVLSQYKIAQFVGSGSDSIQAMASDGAGNIYVAGTTSSPDLPMLNAAQPVIGEAALLRSLDNGATWQKVTSATPLFNGLALAPHPTDPQTLIAGAGSGIYKTTDGGQTWQLVDARPASAIAVDPANPSYVYAFDINKPELDGSSDGGNTWQKLNFSILIPEFIVSIPGGFWVDPNGSGTVRAGFSLSRDHGLTWTSTASAAPPPPGNPTTYTVPDPLRSGWIWQVIPHEPNGLYLSTDWGATWTNKPIPQQNQSVQILLDPEVPNTIYLNEGGMIYLSQDAAASWKRISTGSFTSWTVVSRRCSGGGILASSPSGISFSPDFGATWQLKASYDSVGSILTGPGCVAYATRQWTSDAFVAKVDPTGKPLWSTFLGGMDADSAVAIALDASGNVYVTGNTASPDFPTTQPRTGMKGAQNIFAAKYDPNGNLLYSLVLGGEGADTVSAVSADPQGDAFLAGRTTSTSFPTTPGVLQPNSSGGMTTGFVVRLAPDGHVIYSTYLPNLAPITFPTYQIPPVGILAEAAGTALIGGYGSELSRISSDGSVLTTVSNLPGLIYSLAGDSDGNIYVAGRTTTPPFASGTCSDGSEIVPPGDIFVNKLQPDNLSQVYSARLSGACQSSPGALAVAANGEAILGVWSGAQFALHNPVLATIPQVCPPIEGVSAVARLSADGSSLLFSSELNTCGSAPPVASGTGESLVAAVNTLNASPFLPRRAILQFPVASGPVAVEGVFNSFTGVLDRLNPGMLLTIAGENLAPSFIDMGLNDPNPLPTELGGVQVLFNGIAALIFQVAPDHVICVVPDSVANQASVQVSAGGVPGTPFVLQLSNFSEPGLLTNAFPNPPAAGTDGNIQNADGTPNDADHPAALGSTVTLFANGLAAPGAITLLWGAVPCPFIGSCATTRIPGIAAQMPGFISVLYAVRVTLPSTLAPGVPFTTLPSGVKRIEIALDNSVGIYVQ